MSSFWQKEILKPLDYCKRNIIRKNFLFLFIRKFDHPQIVCLFVLWFYGPVNNEVMLSRSVNSGTVPE